MSELEVIGEFAGVLNELLIILGLSILFVATLLIWLQVKINRVEKYCMWLVSQKHLEAKLNTSDTFKSRIHTKEPF